MVKVWHVYIIRNAHGRLYTGVTNNLIRRMRQHNGQIEGGAKATRVGRPWRIVYAEVIGTKIDALKREAFIKGLTKQAKIELIEECRTVEDLCPENLN